VDAAEPAPGLGRCRCGGEQHLRRGLRPRPAGVRHAVGHAQPDGLRPRRGPGQLPGRRGAGGRHRAAERRLRPVAQQRQPLRLPLLRRAAEHGDVRAGRPQRLPQHVRLDEPGDRQGPPPAVRHAAERRHAELRHDRLLPRARRGGHRPRRRRNPDRAGKPDELERDRRHLPLRRLRERGGGAVVLVASPPGVRRPLLPGAGARSKWRPRGSRSR
jgi:hypothetical protein